TTSGAGGPSASAAVRLARSCCTSFGAPVVPEVRRIHSVSHVLARLTGWGSRVARASTEIPVPISRPGEEWPVSCTRASAAAPAMTAGRGSAGGPAAVIESHSERGLLGKAFVQGDEIAEGHRKVHGALGAEGIDTEGILEARDDDRKAQRVEAALDELGVVAESREFALLLGGDLLELGHDRGLH